MARKSEMAQAKSDLKTHGSANGTASVVNLMKEMWQAAVTLRGSIEAPDYKRYVLPLIFLRFLSLRFEKRQAELEVLVADRKSEYFGDRAVLEDPDEFRSAGAFLVPEKARWQYIKDELARRDDIKTKLDEVLKLLEDTYPEKLRGLLPPVYAGSNIDPENLRALINLFSKDVFKQDHGGEDIIGRVYEYFIGEFASAEGKRGGEYFTPPSIVRTLVAMLEPETGIVFDPCCGSGGMFVQSDVFTHHSGQLSFKGQENKDFTYRLCRMNLFIHGIDGDIQLGDSYFSDKQSTLKADYIIANPPFNDGSKGENGWGANRIPNNDPRLFIGSIDVRERKHPMPLAARNANTMWMLHFLHHLNDTGAAGFVMASGELSSSESARLEVRKTLVELDIIDCIVQMPAQLFANTPIPCALWFLSKNKKAKAGFRERKGEVLFIDARKMGSLIPGSRKQKEFSDTEIEQIAAVYREYKRSGKPTSIPGFCATATTESVVANQYNLTAGPYVGSEQDDDDGEPFQERAKTLVQTLNKQFDQANQLQKTISEILKQIAP